MLRDYIVSDNKTFNYVKARQVAKCQGHIILDQIPNSLEHIEENAVAPVDPEKKGVDSVKRKPNHPKAVSTSYSVTITMNTHREK